MVAESKSLVGVVIFCGIAAKGAIYTRASVYRAFSMCVWWLVIPNTSARNGPPSLRSSPSEAFSAYRVSLFASGR